MARFFSRIFIVTVIVMPTIFTLFSWFLTIFLINKVSVAVSQLKEKEKVNRERNTHSHNSSCSSRRKQMNTATNFQFLERLNQIEGELEWAYIIELHKILCIKLSIDLWLKCCLHFIELVPYNIFEPRMRLRHTNWYEGKTKS